jgi:putative ABC transport system permease protein
MVRDYFSLSFSNLRHKGLRSWLTILGILIGIMSVVALISLGDGLKTAVNSQFGISSTEIITVQAGGLNSYGPPGSGAANPLTVKDFEAIKRLSTVELAIRRNLPSGKLEFNDRLIFGIAGSIPDGEEREFVYEQVELEAEVGRLLKDGDGKKVVLGYNFYDDKVGLEKEVVPGDTIILQDENFEVVGIAKKTGSFVFDNVVYVNDKPLEDLFGYGDEIGLIAVKIKDKDLMQKAKEEIEKSLRKTRDVDIGSEDFEVSTPDAALSTVNEVLTGVQIFIGLVAFISIFVGSIGIVNTMTTSVLERRKEIGIMKAIGARNGQIFALFFIESGLMGLIGGIIGVIFGLLIGMGGTAGINSFLGSNAGLNFNIPLIISALVGSFLVGSVAGIAPAMQAAKQNPVDALRG